MKICIHYGHLREYYVTSWHTVNQWYFNPAEEQFTKIILTNAPELQNKAIPYTLGDSKGRNIGVSLWDSKIEPTIIAVYSPHYSEIGDLKEFDVGDRILSVNNIETKTYAQFLNAIGSQKKGTVVEVMVKKSNGTKELIRVQGQ